MKENAYSETVRQETIIKSEGCQPLPVESPPKMSVSSFAGFLKVKSGLMVYERWSDVSQRGIPVQRVVFAGKNARKYKIS